MLREEEEKTQEDFEMCGLIMKMTISNGKDMKEIRKT